MLPELKTTKLFKYFLFAIVLLITASCSDDKEDGESIPQNDESVSPLEGLWELTSLNNAAFPPGAVYVLLENSTSSGILFTGFTKRLSSNCFNRLSERITRVNANRYRDGAGDFITLTVRNNVLTADFEVATLADQTHIYRPVIEISAQDLPVCRTRGLSISSILSATQHRVSTLQN